MELKLDQADAREILLTWVEKEMPGKFNAVVFSSYGKDVEFIFEDKKEVE
mgnify:CR=1 FL=1